MKGFKSFASAFALVLASASAASAATSGYSEFVESISWETGIGGPQILVTNESSSKLASQASFGIGQINFSIPVTPASDARRTRTSTSTTRRSTSVPSASTAWIASTRPRPSIPTTSTLPTKNGRDC